MPASPRKRNDLERFGYLPPRSVFCPSHRRTAEAQLFSGGYRARLFSGARTGRSISSELQVGRPPLREKQNPQGCWVVLSCVAVDSHDPEGKAGPSCLSLFAFSINCVCDLQNSVCDLR